MCKREKRRGRPGYRRLLAVLLAFLLAAGPFAMLSREVQAASAENPWDGETLTMPETDEDGVYLIRTGAELAWFATEVNKGNGELNARLENYIYLNTSRTAYPWMMIGDTTDHPYRGVFDGNGQKVVYLRAEISTEVSERRYAGLFGVIDGGAVKNLTVLGKVIHGYGNYGSLGESDPFYTGSGGIVGYLKSGQVINCVNYARTTMEGNSMYRNAGGIAGINEGLILHCENQGKLSTTVSIAQNHVGGIAGLVSGSSAQVVNSANSATVQGYFCVGGIAGAVKNGGEINACANYGTVKGNSILGGIAGRVSTTGVYSDGTPKECAIRNVYNLGTLSGYGTGAGTELGGIVGQAGYENWKQETLPPMPVIENAYSTASFANTVYLRRGAVIGYLLSGCYGTVYGRSEEGITLNPVGAKNDRSTQILGESRMLTDEELKSAAMVQKLGSAFTMADSHDTQNQGYPKLTWQGLPSDLLDLVDEAQMELNSWLSDANRSKYGKNYAQLESLVAQYKEQISKVTSAEELEQCMTEAREKLTAVKPGTEADNELAEAIDNAIIALQEYEKKLEAQHTDLTDSQKSDLESLLEERIRMLEQAESTDEVRTLLRDGKDALENRIASYEEDKRLEEIRANAIQVVTDYRAEESYEVVWMHKIKLVRDDALKQIGEAQAAAEVTRLMEKAKADIDAVIDQIPEAGSWDGKTRTEPALDENGVYQITSGSELAWFADAVNRGSADICGALCNDISLGGKSWTPIGDGVAFTGSFEGNGYRIRGLNVDLNRSYAGLFGQTGGSGQKIQNLTVSGTVKVSGSIIGAGGIAGLASGTELINCHSEVTVTVEQMKTLDGGVGGVAGRTQNTVISQCSNSGSVSIPSEGKGGITFYAGGLIGNAGKGTKLQTSYNSGSVTSAHTAGGLVGAVRAAGCEVYSCYNAGEIAGNVNAGGLGGSILDNQTTFNWCYSSGPVNLKQSGRAAGALFGTLASGTDGSLYALKRSDSLGRALVGTSADFSATGKFVSETELKSDDLLNLLNGGGSCYIRDYLGFQSGFPILSWQMSLADFRTGAISELQTFGKEEDYSEENWAQVEELVSEGTEAIRAAQDMESVNAALTLAKNAIQQVETLAGTKERLLQEKKEEAIGILENYVDLSVYRDEEQTEIRDIIANAKKYILLADEESEVERHLDEARAKIDRLPDAWQYYQQANLAAAAQVDSYIINIGEVVYTAYVKTSIQIARSAYDSLTAEQQELVTAYQVLLDAEEAWARLVEENEATEEDLNLAAEVDALIEAIGTVTKDSEDAIYAARLAFDALTTKQQALVSHPETLTAAEEAYDQLWAQEVIAAIAAIGEVTLEKRDVIYAAQEAYDALTDAQKKLVTDYGALQDAMRRYQDLLVVQPVIAQIDELGEITLDSADRITAAIRSYNELTGDQQALVTNYDVLQRAAARYDSLAAIQDVIDRIDRIGTVSSASGSELRDIRAAYDALTAEEQREVTNLSVLEHAEKAYAALQNPTIDGNLDTDTIKGNQSSLADLYRRFGYTEDGTPETTDTPQSETDSTTTGNQTSLDSVTRGGENGETDTAEAADGGEGSGLPDWLESQLGQTADNTAEGDLQSLKLTEARQSLERMQRQILILLGIILAACTALTGAFAVALKKSARKRKEKRVHY